MSKFVKLKDVCLKITDGAHYSPIGISKGFPMFSVKDMRHSGFDYSDCKYISESDYKDLVKADCKPKIHDVLIAKDGSYLKHVFVVKEEKDEVILSSIGILRPHLNKVNPYYLKYFLHINSVKETVSKKYVSGSALPRIILKNFAEIEIVNNDLPTQQKIASVLSALDDKIELNNRINAELEAMAKTLYDYWFVQFDFPVASTGSATEISGENVASTPLSQQSDEKNTAGERRQRSVAERSRGYKSSGGKMVYNETLKREIPEGWEVTVFNDWINETKAGDWGKEAIEGNYTERVYCIRGADINGINGKGEVKAPERFILKNNSSKKLIPNDFVVEISGGSPVQSTGRIALITESTLERFDTDIICSNFCKAVSIKNEKYIYNFKQEWQRLYDAGVFFGFEGKTSGIKNFLFDSFMNSYSIVLPKKEIVEKYYEFAQSIDKKIQSNLKQNQELSALRDWLLPMLMNGQVKVG